MRSRDIADEHLTLCQELVRKLEQFLCQRDTSFKLETHGQYILGANFRASLKLCDYVLTFYISYIAHQNINEEACPKTCASF